MADSEIKRVNFYDRINLGTRGFETLAAEQAYHEVLARLHNRSMHSWGVVYGLQVKPSNDQKSVEVDPGLAIDKDGREVYLAGPTPKKVDLKNNQPCYVTACSDLAKGDITKDIYQGSNTYWRQLLEAKLDTAPTSPKLDGSVILLAKVERNQDGTVTKIDQSVRQSAGAVLNPKADIAARGLTLTGAATLQNGLTVQGDVAKLQKGLMVSGGSAELKNGLTVEGGTTVKNGLTVENALTIEADGAATFNKGPRFEQSATFVAGPRFEQSATFVAGPRFEQSATFVAGPRFEQSATFVAGPRFEQSATFVAGPRFEQSATFVAGPRFEQPAIFVAGPSFENGATVNKGLTVEGNVTLKNKLTLTGAATLQNGLTVQGDVARLQKGLMVSGGSAELKNGLTVEGGTTVKNGLTVENALTIEADGAATFNKGPRFEQSATFVAGPRFEQSATFVAGPRFEQSATFVAGPRFEQSATFVAGPRFENGATVNKGLTVEGDVTLKNKLSFGQQYGDSLLIFEMGKNGTSLAVGVQQNTLYHRSSGNFAWYTGGKESSDKALDPGGGTRVMSLTSSEVRQGTAPDEVKIGPGLTVEVDATFKGNVRLGFSPDNTGEREKMVWLRNQDLMNPWNEYLFKHPSDKGHFQRAGFGINIHSSREFGIWSTRPEARAPGFVAEPVSLFSVRGDDGAAFFKGNLTVAGIGTKLAQEAWIDVNSFFTSWKTLGDPHPPAGYFKDSLGIVHLRGVVEGGSAGPDIFLLPKDYRPGSRSVHIVLANNQIARIDVFKDGTVRRESGGLGRYSLDGITFRAEA